MATCSQCGKFVLFGLSGGLCNQCKEETENKAKSKHQDLNEVGAASPVNDVYDQVFHETRKELQRISKQLKTGLDELQLTYMTNYESIVNSRKFAVLSSMNDSQFETFCKRLLEKKGFMAFTIHKNTQKYYFKAICREPFTAGHYLVCFDRFSETVNDSDVSEFYNTLLEVKAIKGVFITTGGYSGPAINFASQKPLELIGGKAFWQIAYDCKMPGICFSLETEIKCGCLDDRSPLERGREFDQLVEHLSYAPHDYSARNKIIDRLYAHYMAELWNTSEHVDIRRFTQYKIECANELLKYLQYYTDTQSSKYGTIRLNALVLSGGLYFMIGDFANAVLCWKRFLDDGKVQHAISEMIRIGSDFRENNYSLDEILHVVANIRAVYNILGLPASENMIDSQYADLIDVYHARDRRIAAKCRGEKSEETQHKLRCKNSQLLCGKHNKGYHAIYLPTANSYSQNGSSLRDYQMADGAQLDMTECYFAFKVGNSLVLGSELSCTDETYIVSILPAFEDVVDTQRNIVWAL